MAPRPVVACLTIFAGGALFAGVLYLTPTTNPPDLTATIDSPAPRNEARSGSIVVSTPNSNDCRRYRLDNTTGEIEDNGNGDCGKRGGGQRGRIEAISNGFRRQ